jgi:hypothetical protein
VRSRSTKFLTSKVLDCDSWHARLHPVSTEGETEQQQPFRYVISRGGSVGLAVITMPVMCYISEKFPNMERGQMKPIQMNPSQVARLAPALRVALTFIEQHFPQDIRAGQAGPIKRAYKSLEAPADADGQIAALVWSIDFIMTHHEGAGPPKLGEAFMLLDELKLVTREQLTGGTA